MESDLKWVETTGLEKEIILCVRKNKKGISQISRELKTTAPNISVAVARMVKEKTLIRENQYSIDARFSKVIIDKDRIKITKIVSFYKIFFILCFFSIFFSIFLSVKYLSTYFLIGNLVGIIPLLIYSVYNAYINEDRIIVEKLDETS